MGTGSGVDMMKVINQVAKNDRTLFKLSSLYSKKATSLLMKIIPADQRAQHLLNVELGDAYNGSDYDKLISSGLSGYAHFYLKNAVNWDKCLSRAKHVVIMQLAEIDLKKGTKLEQIVFNCCWYAPLKRNIERLISLANEELVEEKLKKILEYQDMDGYNCYLFWQ